MTKTLPLIAAPTSQSLSEVATGRAVSLLQPDIDQSASRISEQVAGKKILAIGAAGSIGAATLEVLVSYGPSAFHVVDQNENELAELVRKLRSRPEGLDVADFRTLPLDYGSPAMRLLLQEQSPYDMVLNFAAIKHVRSEKDAFSMMQMFDTNFRKQAQLIRWLAEVGFEGRFFSVSTDKAANPSSLMGASKRLMEHVMFSGEVVDSFKGTVSSARFANVAFSNGSLLQSFQRRIEQNQPLASPKDTKRYFVSLEEAGQLCTIATICGPDGGIVVPNLNPEDHLVPLESVARNFLEKNGLEPVIFSDETAARQAVQELKLQGKWPLLLTPLDTAGEKPYEEFIAEGESAEDFGLSNLLSVPYKSVKAGLVASLIAQVDQLFKDLITTDKPVALEKDYLKNLVAQVEPAFLTTHRASEKSLDNRV